MRINNNIPALNTHRLLNINTNNLEKTLERLSSGREINRHQMMRRFSHISKNGSTGKRA